MERKTGVNVQFIHPTMGSENEEFRFVAGRDHQRLLNEWTISYAGGPAAAEDEGVLINLDKYISPTGEAAICGSTFNNPLVNTEANDLVVTVSHSFVETSIYNVSGLIYRSDLFEKAGVTKVPVTIDDWTEALTKLKAYGIEKPMVQQSIDNLQSGTMNAYKIRGGMFVDDTTGKVEYGFIEDGYKEWMLQMNEWVAGLLDEDILTSNRTTLETYIMTGVGAACYGAGGGYMGTFLTTAAAEPDVYGKDFDLAAANFPVLNEGEMVMYGGASYDYATTSKASAVITADCKYPEIAAKFLNFSYSGEGHINMNFGEEGKSFTFVNGEPIYTDEVMKNPDGLSLAVAMAHWGH